MKKRFIPTLIAFVILIVLGIYCNYNEVEDIARPGEVKPVSILGFKEDEIKSISFGKGEKYDLKVELASPSAFVVAPSNYSADDAEAYGVARHFTELQSEYLFENTATDTSMYGFATDSLSVKFETASQVVELTLGNQVEIGNSLYLKKKGDNNIYIVPAHIKGSFEKTLTDIRNKALYLEDFGKCSEIVYACGSENFTLEYKENNSEWIIANTKYSTDGVEVANLINNMRNLRISNFEDGNASDEKYGLANPVLSISIKSSNGKTYMVKAGESQGSETYVTNDDKTVQLVNSTNINDLKLTMNKIREKFLDIAPFTELTEIEVTDATGTIKIAKVDSNWMLGEIKLKDSEVKDFTNSMKRAKVVEFSKKENLEGNGFGDLDKCSKIIITAKNGEVKHYWIGSLFDSNVFLMDDEEMMLISAELKVGFETFMKRLRASETSAVVASGTPAVENSVASETTNK